jgi:hypothetical protein
MSCTARAANECAARLRHDARDAASLAARAQRGASVCLPRNVCHDVRVRTQSTDLSEMEMVEDAIREQIYARMNKVMRTVLLWSVFEQWNALCVRCMC